MKKQLFTAAVAILLSISAHSQDQEVYRIITTLEDLALNKQLYYDPQKTLGTPYLNVAFAPAKVSNVDKTAMLRYDAFRDEFEFINEKLDTLVLNKKEPFTSITFTLTKTTYQLTNYSLKGKETTGYLISLFQKNNYVLYKKQNILFSKERLAKSGYESNTPAKFERGKDTFFLKDGDKGISEFPSNKKALLKLYPDKKTEIEAFIKQNNIDFDKEPDIIKLVDFLAT
jgi:hypothetical protein